MTADVIAFAGITNGEAEMLWVKPVNVWIGDRRTSLRLEPEFWTALQDVAVELGSTVHELVRAISINEPRPLSSAVRVWLLRYYRDRAQELARLHEVVTAAAPDLDHERDDVRRAAVQQVRDAVRGEG